MFFRTSKQPLYSLLGAAVLAFSAVMLSGTTLPAFAQEGRQFSAKTGEIVSAAIKLINSNQRGAALEKLGEALKQKELSAYERSTIYQMQGASYYELGQLGPALEALQKAEKAGGLLPKELEGLKVHIAQLQIANGQYAQGAQFLETYLNNGGQRRSSYIKMVMKGWMQAEDYARALPWAEQWFEGASPKERMHFDVMNAVLHRTGETGRQADIIKKMISRWPEDEELWEAWTSILANEGREKEAFEITKLRYLSGVLTDEPDVLKVVQYYSFYNMPYQAAEILEREMEAGRVSRNSENMVQLSSLLRQAREYKKAIPVLENAANSSGEARLYAQLGEALYNEGQCKQAEMAFKKAINGGYDAGKSWMLIATCRYEEMQTLERIDCAMSEAETSQSPIVQARGSAIRAFQQVPDSSRVSGDAKKWVSFIKAEEDAVKRRCDFAKKLKVDECFQHIKRAYDEVIFVGDFELYDPSCRGYRAEFDAKYRAQVVEE